MSLVTDFAMQTVGLRRKVSEDPEWHEVTYDPPEPDPPLQITAVYLPDKGLARTATGNRAPVDSRVITETELHLGDLIEGSEVVRVRTLIEDGEVIGYAADL